MPNLTRSQATAGDVAASLRARDHLLWIVTGEEARVESYLFQAALSSKYVPHTWDVAAGVRDIEGNAERDIGGQGPDEILGRIEGRIKSPREPQRDLWILRDLPSWLKDPQVLRQLRNVVRASSTADLNAAQALVVLSPDGNVPPELAGQTTVIEWPLPDREEIGEILDARVEATVRQFAASSDAKVTAKTILNGSRDAAIDAAVGLSGDEAQACYAKSLVQSRKIDVALVAREKKRAVARDGLIEWIEPIPGGLDAVGGLDILKTWLVSRGQAFGPRARAYGLPAPRGALIVGVPGCGKSLLCKAISTAWKVPLLRLDLGALRSKFVGESEGNLRKVIATIEALGRCVVWIDEIEKALQGATSGSADGGVSADALGTLLSWMQDRRGESFVIATANDVSQLPPELLRKGRFDEIFFVDLPNDGERGAVLETALKQARRQDVGVDLVKVAQVTRGFTGAEISALVPDSLFAAFADGEREINTDDLIAAAGTVKPLSVTAKEKIDKLREWAAEGRARPATSNIAGGAGISKKAAADLDI